MKLRTYIILAVVSFLAVAVWLSPHPDTMIGWQYVIAAFYMAAAVILGLAIVYALGRLFWAIVHRLER